MNKVDFILKRTSTLRTYDKGFLTLIYMNFKEEVYINLDKIGSRYYLVFNSGNGHLSLSCDRFTIDDVPFNEEWVKDEN